jgi:nucleoside-diphosphate-sugar epimerase
MRLLLTGLSGTLAPRLAAAATRVGHEVIGWDRVRASTDDTSACRRWLESAAPDAIAHLALGPIAWAEVLAAYADAAGLPMVLTSTAMVFHHEPDGPHAPDHVRTAQDEYGRYKIACEDAVRAACASACIARIGWQIDADGRGKTCSRTWTNGRRAMATSVPAACGARPARSWTTQHMPCSIFCSGARTARCTWTAMRGRGIPSMRSPQRWRGALQGLAGASHRTTTTGTTSAWSVTRR